MIESDSKPILWITGGGGLIGNYLVQLAPRFAPKFQAVGSTRAKLDLLDFKTVCAAFQEQKPKAIIHCAAMSKSPECQANPALARKINVEVTAQLAELAADIPFIFFSTDLVFNGRKGNYVETDALEPLSVYAETKVAAEQIVLANPRHTVIRTSLNGGISPTGDRGFNEQIYRSWRAGETLRLFVDEYRSPIPAAVTARATWELLEQRATGLFHIAGRARLSRLEIGEVLAQRHPELQPKIIPTSLREYCGAPRSPDTSLNCTKVQARLSFQLPALREWLAANPTTEF